MTIAMAAPSVAIMAQSPRPPKLKPGQQAESPETPNLTAPTKAMLEANAKELKKKAEKLFQLASELKDEVEKTDSAQVLSVSLVKKAEEIEKLAREIKSRSKG
jgi:hypothetical protein